MICKRFAVFGSPINHSLSPLIHYLFAKQTGIKLRYDKQLVEPQNFNEEVRYFFKNGGYGLNITSPLKELAYKISDAQTTRAKKARAINTLWYKDGKIHADNTDGDGLIMDLKKHISLKSKKIFIVGAGGAARGIINALFDEHPHSISILNRSDARMQNLIQDFSDKTNLYSANFNKKYDLIINTTPTAAEIAPDSIIKNAEFCYDLTYRYDGKTAFEIRSLELGVPAKNGLGMLVNQAALSFAAWHNVSVDSNLFRL